MSGREITISISEDTVRKFQGYAVLSGQGVDALEKNIDAFLNDYFTEKCAEVLGIKTTPNEVPVIRVEETSPLPKKNKFLEAAEDKDTDDSEAAQHTLSDDDAEEVESEEDRYERLKSEDVKKETKPGVKKKSFDDEDEDDDFDFDPDSLKVKGPAVKDVGDRADAFLAAVYQNSKKAEETSGKRRTAKAKRVFDETKPRVSITLAGHEDDEEDPGVGF